MRLDVDLAFDAVPGQPLWPGEARAVELHMVAAAVRSPLTLRRLLGGSYDEVRVRTGDLPLSALQALALLTLVLARAPRYVIDGRPRQRSLFLAHALAVALVAIPSELVCSAILARRVQRYARPGYHLPTSCPKPRTAIYLRIDPTLKWLGSQVGGAATHTSGVINGMIANGLEVEVLAAEQPQDTRGARFSPVPVRRVLHLVRGLTYTDFSESVLEVAAERRGDFIYQRHQLGSYAGLELARRLGVPLVLEFNGSEIWVERNWGSGSLRLAGLLEQLERRNLLEASLVVVVSAPLRDQVVDLGVDHGRVLVNPNGVDTDRLASLRTDPAPVWRERLGMTEQATVGFIGTFGPWHGVRLLPDLIERVPGTRFVLIGDGGLLGEIRAELDGRGLTDRTVCTGLLERGPALELLSACDVCISPHVPNPDGSPFFGSPTKLFEYMGLGKPIVAADLDQIGEVIEHERNGLLHPPGDAGAAAAAVRRLLADPVLRSELAAEALADAVERYSWTAHVRRILDALSVGTAPTGSANSARRP